MGWGVTYGVGGDLRGGRRRGSRRSLLRELCCGKDTLWGGHGTGSTGGHPPTPPRRSVTGTPKHDSGGTPGSLLVPSPFHIPRTPRTGVGWGGSAHNPPSPRDPPVTLPARRGVRGAGGPQPMPGGGGAAAGAVPSPGLLRSARGQQKVGHVCLGRHRNSSGGFKTRRTGLEAPPHSRHPHATGRSGWPPPCCLPATPPTSEGWGVKDAAPMGAQSTPRRTGVRTRGPSKRLRRGRNLHQPLQGN